MTTTSACPDLALPLHWGFASLAAYENIGIMLQDANLVLPTVFLLDQLVAAFLSDPLIQSDPQQFALWGQLHERIAPVLEQALQRGLVDSEASELGAEAAPACPIVQREIGMGFLRPAIGGAR